MQHPSRHCTPWRRIRAASQIAFGCFLLGLTTACQTNHPFFVGKTWHPDFSDSRLDHARALYERGAYEDALLECVELSQADDPVPGLEEFRLKVLQSAMEQRAAVLAARAGLSDQHLVGEALAGSLVPESYGTARTIEALPADSLRPDGPMREVLATPVTLHLKGASLAALIEALSADPNINIIADHGLGETQQIDIEVADAPLREVLQYAERNLGIRFYLGEGVLWFTSREEGGHAPRETRTFRLRHGLQMHGNEWDATAAKDQSAISRLTHQATVLATNRTYLETVIEKMVPAQEGAVIHLDRNTHTLFVRNTRENLDTIASIVESLDVSPPQVLIEARFIEVMVGDLRDLGISWILDSPWVLTKNFKVERGEVAFGPNRRPSSGPTCKTPKRGSFGLFETPSQVGQGTFAEPRRRDRRRPSFKGDPACASDVFRKRGAPSRCRA